MIVSHIGFGGKYDYWVHAFNMPMFFFVTGYFAKPVNNIAERFKEKARKLLIPYIITGTVHLILWCILFPEKGIKDAATALVWINTNNMPMCGALWFITALLISDTLFSVLEKYIKHQVVLLSSVVLFATIGIAIPKYLGFQLPWASDAAFVGISIMYIASRLKRNCPKLFKINNIALLIIAGILCSILIFMNGYINMRTANYANPILFVCNAVFASLVGLNLCCCINKRISGRFSLRLLSYIKRIGRDSIIYLCFNQISIMPFQRIATAIGGHVFIRRGMIFVGTMLLLELIYRLIMHTKLKRFFIF